MFLVMAGRLGDIYGPRLIWAMGCIVMIVCNIGSGFATSAIGFDIARAVAGIGAALACKYCHYLPNRGRELTEMDSAECSRHFRSHLSTGANAQYGLLYPRCSWTSWVLDWRTVRGTFCAVCPYQMGLVVHSYSHCFILWCRLLRLTTRLSLSPCVESPL